MEGNPSISERARTWSTTFPEPVYLYLKSYNLTLEEILKEKIQWDENKQRLIYPCFDPNGNLVMFQGRYFGKDKDHPKYITHGNVSDTLNIHWNDESKKEICVVEDFLSAIKVARVTNSIPMWGSSLSRGQIKQLANMFPTLYWWSDPDKQKDYPKVLNKTSLFFDKVKCVYSKLDPKYYDQEEISSLLYEN